MQDAKVMNGSGGTIDLLGNRKPVLGGEVLGDPLPSKTKKHHVDKLTNTLIEIGGYQVYVAQVNRHMYALDWTEDFVDGSLILKTMDKVNRSALCCYHISVRFQANSE